MRDPIQQVTAAVRQGPQRAVHSHARHRTGMYHGFFTNRPSSAVSNEPYQRKADVVTIFHSIVMLQLLVSLNKCCLMISQR